MGYKAVLAGIAVKDIEAAKAWYEDFLGRPADRVPMDNDAEWDFPNGSTLQVFHDADRAGHSSITLQPDDLGEDVEQLANRGIAPQQRHTGLFEIAIFADPDGNQIVLAEKA